MLNRTKVLLCEKSFVKQLELFKSPEAKNNMVVVNNDKAITTMSIPIVKQ